jgi:hypothetical protein
VDEIFKLDIRFVSENWRGLLSSGSALQTIESLSEDIVLLAVKQRMAEAILKDFYKDGEKNSIKKTDGRAPNPAARIQENINEKI